jgi:hypothetical protein
MVEISLIIFKDGSAELKQTERHGLTPLSYKYNPSGKQRQYFRHSLKISTIATTSCHPC